MTSDAQCRRPARRSTLRVWRELRYALLDEQFIAHHQGTRERATGESGRPLPSGNHALAQVQLLQFVQVQGLQVQALVVADMVCSSSEVDCLRLTTRT